MGPRSDFSKPCQGAAEKSANATRRCCLVRGFQPVGMSPGDALASFCTMRRFFCHSLQNRASFVLTAQSDVCRTSRHNVHSFTRSFVKNDNSPIRSTQPPNGCLFKVRFPPTRSTHRERMTLKFFKLLQRNIEDPGATSQTQKSPRKSTT